MRRFTDRFGPDHPLTLESAVNLVADLRSAGERERAEALGKDPIGRLAERIGAGHPMAEAAAQGPGPLAA